MSVTPRQAEQFVYDRFKTAWATAYPMQVVYVENDVRPEPEDPTVYWVRCTMLARDANQHTLNVPGLRQWRRQKSVMVQLYGPVSTGVGTLSDMKKAVMDIFEGASFNGIDPEGACREETLGSNGRFYEVVVIAPIVYYETR